MPRRARLLAMLAALLVFTSVLAIGSAAQAACDPFTAPVYAGKAPSPKDVLGFSLGSQEVTDHQIVTYLDAIDAGSTAVTTAKAATSVQGRAIKYAIVGKPSNVTPSALATLRADAEALRDPTLPQSQAGAIESSMPRILWLAGNVHGTEESGADAGSPDPLRPRRPNRLRRQGDHRRFRRVHHADAEPRWTGARDATQRVRVRHEPGLVRSHAARDRRQGRGAPAVPADAVHGRARVR